MCISNENMADDTSNTGSTITVSNSSFMANNDGAVIKSDHSSDIMFNYSNFTENEVSNDGGAFYTVNCTVCFTSCNFDNNKAGDSGGAVHGREYSTIIISNTIVNNCRAINSGGGVYIEEECSVYIENSSFTNNSADYGKQCMHGGTMMSR